MLNLQDFFLPLLCVSSVQRWAGAGIESSGGTKRDRNKVRTRQESLYEELEAPDNVPPQSRELPVRVRALQATVPVTQSQLPSGCDFIFVPAMSSVGCNGSPPASLPPLEPYGGTPDLGIREMQCKPSSVTAKISFSLLASIIPVP